MYRSIRTVFRAAYIASLALCFRCDASPQIEDPLQKAEAEAHNTIEAIQLEQAGDATDIEGSKTESRTELSNLQAEQAADAQALNAALEKASNSKEREALATAFAQRVDARIVKIQAAEEKLETLEPAASKPSIEARIPSSVPEEAKAALREQYALLDDLDALKGSTKALDPARRSEAYRAWYEAKGSQLEAAQKKVAAQLEKVAATEPSGPPPNAPAIFSAEGKTAWAKCQQLQAKLAGLAESTKSLTPAARSQAYTEWFQANAPALEDAQRKIAAATETVDSKPANP